MATTTPNFGWSVPTSSDLVKNGATAIETLGDAIDASLVDLKGGTTGQVLTKASGTDMDFTWATASGGSSNVAGKNLCINGGFDVWQRGTSFTASSVYTADRWFVDGGTGRTFSQIATSDTTNLPTLPLGLRMQRNSGQTWTGAFGTISSFENLQSQALIGQTVTLSFWARKGANYSGTSDAFTVKLYAGTGTNQRRDFSSAFTGETQPISSSATLTSSWQRFTYSATVGATMTQVAIGLYYSATGTAGTADYADITGVQLEVASSASAFSRNGSSYQEELAVCQRYYYRTTATQAYSDFGSGYNKTTTEGSFMIPFPVTMRTTPTALEQTGTASNYNILHASGGSPARAACSSVPTYQVATPTMGRVDFIVASGLTSGNGAIAGSNNNTTAYLGWSAEL